ncbi:uncharacterized protein LOC143474448 isoform X6 [Brachyhypopomus gauderio]|uniref:uncharacterized protein LOC143474448 isoform X6 n=1 Tax=Brachyhypopomus gauderio TaxID=698409 RepID=UPI004042C60D
MRGEMQFLSALLCGTLISCFCCLGCSGNFMVTQTPPTLMIMARASVQMSCCWDQSIDGPKVKWLKDTVELNMSDPRLQRENRANSCTTLTITNTCKTDAGSYICEVTRDIPILHQVKGPGTNVTYQEENGWTTPPTPPDPVVLLGSVASVVGVMCVCACLTIWKLCRDKRRTERLVIREGPPSEGDEPEISEEEEQSSRNSRGSTQWYMVPVYESYFDLQRNDEQESTASEKTGSTTSENTRSTASVKTGSTASKKKGSTASKKKGSTVFNKTGSSASVKIGSSASKKTGSTVSKKTGSTVLKKTGSTISKKRGSS